MQFTLQADSLFEARQMHGATGGATVSIALHRDLATGDWFVESVNMRFGQIRNTTTFSTPMLLCMAFTPQACAFFEEHLPRNANPQVISMRDCELHLDQLVMSGLRMMIQKVSDGIQKVIIRFQEAFGALHQLFAPVHRGYIGEAPLPLTSL